MAPPTPTITSISPNIGTTPSPDQVTITGTNFGTMANTTVTFGTISVTPGYIENSTTMYVNPPVQASAAVDVTVTVDGVESTTSVTYTYTNLPTITNGEGFKGFTNVSNKSFYINGINFSDYLTDVLVSFNGFPLIPTDVNTTYVRIILPTSSTTGSVPVFVTINGTNSNTVNFTYYNKPTITSVTPDNGPTTGDTPITIVGTNFLSNSLVKINGATATNIAVNGALTQITCNTPRSNAGDNNLYVTVAQINPYQDLESDPSTYTYNAVTSLGSMISIAFSGLKGVGISNGDNGYYGLFYTIDGGQFWTPSNLSTAYSNGGTNRTFVAIDGDNAIALCSSFADAGQATVYYSSNAGQTWTPSTYNGVSDSFLSINGNGPAMAIRGTTALLGAGANSGHVLYSTNSGANWVDCAGAINYQFFAIQMAPNGRAVGISGDPLFFVNNTLGWQPVTVPTTGGAIFAVSMNDVGHAIYGTDFGMFYSTDYGVTLVTSAFPPAIVANGANLLCIDAGSDNCIAVGTDNLLYYSANGGQTWAAATAPDVLVGGPYALMIRGTRAIIGSSVTSLFSTDSGHTWTQSTTSNIQNTQTGARFLAGVDTEGNISGVISTNTNTFYTIDGGNNWLLALCFKEGTKILTDRGYVLIQHLRKGDLIKTVSSGFKKIEHIGYSKIHHNTDDDRVKDKLYRCPMSEYPELIEDLVITGGHSILVKEFKDDEQMEKNKAVFGSTPVIDEHFKLLAFIDDKTKIFEEEGVHTIWHFALENTDEFGKYGVYANGLLVETIDINGIFIKEYNMTLIE